jgi:hypothetical protein
MNKDFLYMILFGIVFVLGFTSLGLYALHIWATQGVI